MATKTNQAKKDISAEEKLRALYSLQEIDSNIDRIRTVRGELPLEVQDLEDEIEGLETRLNNLTDEMKAMEDGIAEKKNLIKDAQAAIRKYEGQQSNVRNNREFDSLSKEIEFQNLEIQLAEKRIKEHKANIDAKKEVLEASQSALDERSKDLEHKKGELEDIVKETQKEEEALIKASAKAEKVIEERLLGAYKRIRGNARNGLAVVKVERDACGGCFNTIPPQRQLDIKTHKKIIVCEHCGRILVDPDIQEDAQ
ncbi:MAG: C4-type zinc ribbon domain-containing protein [Bacteroidota bacterium]